MEMDTHNATMPPATAFGQLRLIEIMRNVVSQTDSVKALAHCARLNSDWYCEVIPRLWRGQGYDVMSAEDDWRTPSVEFLNNLAVVSKSRLNALLRNVRFLDLWSVKDPDDISESDEDARLDPRYLPRKRGPQDAPALWAPEVWHRVRPLVLRTDAGFRGLREKDFRVLLKPSLRLVELTTDDCGVRFFEILQQRTPNLKWLHLREDIVALEIDALTKYLGHNGLHGLHLQAGSLIEGPWSLLAQSLHLRHLSIGPTRDTLTPSILENSAHKFSSLRSLELSWVREDTLRLLITCMPHLQKFTVWNYGAEPLNGTRTLDLLSRFARLEEVTLTYPDWTQLDAEALQKIACGCPRIRSFQYLVNAEDNQTYSPPALPASILRTIAIAWPQIQKLALEVPFEATGRDLLPFAEHCPKLIEFEVPLHFCFGDLEDFPPGTFFPRLESIRADWAVQTLLSCNDPGAEVPDKVLEDLKQNVERVMPRLLGLSVFSDKDDNTMDIINRLNDAIGEKPKAPLPQSVMERLQHEAVFGS